VKILELRLDDAVMSDLEEVCAEQHMDAAAWAAEAVRRYVAAERARGALGSSELISAYAELSGMGEDAFEEEGLFVS